MVLIANKSISFETDNTAAMYSSVPL